MPPRRRFIAHACLGLASPAFAAVPRDPLDLDLAQREWIERRPTVRYVQPFEARPYAFVENGTLRGIAAVLLEAAGEMTGLRFEAVDASPGGDPLERLARGDIDLVPMLGVTAPRGETFAFTSPYATMPFGLYTRPDFWAVGSVAELGDHPVGVPFGVSARLSEADRPVAARPFLDAGAGVRALLDGAIDAIVAPIPIVQYWIRRYRTDRVWLQAPLESTLPLAMACSRASGPLVEILDRVLGRIHAPERRQLYADWMQAAGGGPGIGAVLLPATIGAAGLGAWAWRRRQARDRDAAPAQSQALGTASAPIVLAPPTPSR